MSTVVIALAFALAFALAMTIAKAGFLAGKPAPAPETPETGATAPLDTAPPRQGTALRPSRPVRLGL